MADIAGKKIGKRHVPGPQGVRGRNSDNRLIREKLRWEPSQSLRAGLEHTYKWIEGQVMRNVIPETQASSDALKAAREVDAALVHAG